MVECWYCASHSHEEENCPHRVPTASWPRQQALPRVPREPPPPHVEVRPVYQPQRSAQRQLQHQLQRPVNAESTTGRTMSNGTLIRQRRPRRPLAANPIQYSVSDGDIPTEWSTAGRREEKSERELDGRGVGGDTDEGSGREEEDDLRQMWRLCGAAVMYAAAQDVVEDLALATPVRHGMFLIVCGMLARAGGYSFLLFLWTTVLITGGVLWVTSSAPLPPSNPPNAPPSSSSALQEATGTVGGGFWVGVPADRERGRVRFSERVFSVRNVKSGLMALACLPSMLDMWSQWLFFGLAGRVDSGWLSVALGVASAVYTGAVLAAVTYRGPSALTSGLEFRFLKLSWYIFLLHATVMLATRWGWSTTRRAISAALLAAASAKTAVPARTIDHSVRRGLSVTLGDLLRNVPSKVSTESLLHLAFARWLLDHWAQAQQFSPRELRRMLLKAYASCEAERDLRRSNAMTHAQSNRRNVAHEHGICGRLDNVGVVDEQRGTNGEIVRKKWLNETEPELLKTRIQRQRLATSIHNSLDALSPGRASCAAIVFVQACPSLCVTVLIVMIEILYLATIGGYQRGATQLHGILLLFSIFSGPVAIEILRAKALWKEVFGKLSEESDGRARPPADGLTILLRRFNPGLLQVWTNARLAADGLPADMPESSPQYLGAIVSSVRSSPSNPVADSLLDLATRIQNDGLDGAAGWIMNASTFNSGNSSNQLRSEKESARRHNSGPSAVGALETACGNRVPGANGTTSASVSDTRMSAREGGAPPELAAIEDNDQEDARSITRASDSARTAPVGSEFLADFLPPGRPPPPPSVSEGLGDEQSVSERELTADASLAPASEMFPLSVVVGAAFDSEEGSDGGDAAASRSARRLEVIEEMVEDDESEIRDGLGDGTSSEERGGTFEALGEDEEHVDNASRGDDAAVVVDPQNSNASMSTGVVSTTDSLTETPQETLQTQQQQQRQRPPQEEEKQALADATTVNTATDRAATGDKNSQDKPAGGNWVIGAGAAVIGAAGNASDAIVGATSVAVDVAGGLAGTIGGAAGDAVGFVVHMGTFGWWGGEGAHGEKETNSISGDVAEEQVPITREGEWKVNGIRGGVDAVVGEVNSGLERTESAKERDGFRGRGGCGDNGSIKGGGGHENGCADVTSVNGWTVRTFGGAGEGGGEKSDDDVAAGEGCSTRGNEGVNVVVQHVGNQENTAQSVVYFETVEQQASIGVDGNDVAANGSVFGIRGKDAEAESIEEQEENPVDENSTVGESDTCEQGQMNLEDITVGAEKLGVAQDQSIMEDNKTSASEGTVKDEITVDGGITAEREGSDDVDSTVNGRASGVSAAVAGGGGDEAGGQRVAARAEAAQELAEDRESPSLDAKADGKSKQNEGGFFADIAGWTVSSAVALAGGAAIVLLSGFHDFEGGGDHAKSSSNEDAKDTGIDTEIAHQDTKVNRQDMSIDRPRRD